MPLTLEYNPQNSTITLNSYTDDEFLIESINITEECVKLALEKLMNDYNLEEGGELVIRRDSDLKTKIPLKTKIK